MNLIVIELMIAVLQIGNNEKQRPSTQHNSPKIARHAKRWSKYFQLKYKTTNYNASELFLSFGAYQLTRDTRNMIMVAGHNQDFFLELERIKSMRQIANSIVYNTSQSNIFISGELLEGAPDVTWGRA